MPDDPLFAEMNACDHLFLRNIFELGCNGILLLIDEGTVSDEVAPVKVGDVQIEDCQRIEPTEQDQLFEIHFPDYVAYSVLNESYALPDGEGEISEGKLVRVYSKSRFLDCRKREKPL